MNIDQFEQQLNQELSEARGKQFRNGEQARGRLQKIIDRVLVRHYKEIELLQIRGLIVRYDISVPRLWVASVHSQKMQGNQIVDKHS
ncbi:hypothetical protein [Sporolactobacillus sp. KGMB 08714]|uniref:hypothetical protein n=1 Tax=Sporolactobacillus sp. KGMB 08714 TaxID=3064704 RepID=UPI002FBD71D0